MSIWKDIQQIFNNREIALIIWFLVILIAGLISNVRESIFSIFKILCKKVFLVLFLFIGIYLLGIILIFVKLGLWDNAYFKDVVIWLFSVGLVMVFKINNANSSTYFKSIFYSAIKWTILLEFAVNLYSFNLITEIIIFPVMAFLALTQAFAERDNKHLNVSNLLQNILAILGSFIFLYSVYKTFLNFDEILTLRSFIVFLLSSTITILFIPFVYLLALYSTYESYFVSLNFMTRDAKKVKVVKMSILRIANINYDKLLRIKKNFEKKAFYDERDIKTYIQLISKKY